MLITQIAFANRACKHTKFAIVLVWGLYNQNNHMRLHNKQRSHIKINNKPGITRLISRLRENISKLFKPEEVEIEMEGTGYNRHYRILKPAQH
jgi:hypothetical protein